MPTQRLTVTFQARLVHDLEIHLASGRTVHATVSTEALQELCARLGSPEFIHVLGEDFRTEHFRGDQVLEMSSEGRIEAELLPAPQLERGFGMISGEPLKPLPLWPELRALPAGVPLY